MSPRVSNGSNEVGTKRILLWNPISNHGHLNSYLSIYTDCIVGLGYEVSVLANLDEENEKAFRLRFPKIDYLDSMELRKPLVRWTYKWLLEVATNKLIKDPLGFLTNVWKQLSHQVRSPKQAASVSWLPITKKLRELRVHGKNFDLVFCMYLDMMSKDSREISRFEASGIPWTGLLFHPQASLSGSNHEIEPYFASSQNRGAAFFTEEYLFPYSKTARENQHFWCLPDIATVDLSEKHEFAEKIDLTRNGRKVVAIVGSITSSKMIAEFVALSQLKKYADLLFVITGEIHHEALEVQDRDALEDFVGNNRNTLLLNGYIESDAEYDSVLNSVDIFFSAYRSFTSSSNSLAKSALLRKPIIVVDNGLMGKIVREFQTGEAAAGVSLLELEAALDRALKNCETQKYQDGFVRLSDILSAEKLKYKLEGALAQWTQ